MPVALIVDDNHLFIIMLTFVLEHNGFEVATAGDGEEGYTKFRDHMARIDTVITDLMMPKLSGIELCKRIKKDRPEVPVVLVTGLASACDKLQPDFDLVFSKPLEPDFVDRVKLMIYGSKV